MRHAFGHFDSPEELGAILARVAKEFGLKEPGVCLGCVDVTYSIGPHINHGSFGVFVGESVQEELDKYIEGMFESWRRMYAVISDENYPIKDDPTVPMIKDMIENYSQKDVKLIDWKFTRED